MSSDWTNGARSIDSFQDDDEIDLLELLATLRSRAALIATIAAAALALAVCYAIFVATPMFEAKSTLVLKESSSGPNLGQLEGLASLAGVSLGSSGGADSELFEDRVMTRDFILGIIDSAGLERDPFFNSLLKAAGPVGSALVKIGVRAPRQETRAEIEENIVESYRRSVSVNITKSGVIEVVTQHEDPIQAAVVANAIVEKALADLLEEQADESHARVEYLASELYRAQEDLDAAAQAIEDFTVESHLVSTEELALVSMQLGDLRKKRERILNYETALIAIREMSSPGNSVARQDLNALLDRYPDANDLDFRRLLGWSGNMMRWVWPDDAELGSAQLDVAQWHKDIDRQISESEALVRNNATAAGQLARLQREVTVQEAIYKALLQQFESQNLAGGFEGTIGQVFEAAVAPTRPVAPRKAMIAALGLVLGLVLGAGLALILSMRRGILHTRRAISEATGLRPWGTGFGRAVGQREKDTQALLRRMTQRRLPELEEVAFDLTNHNVSQIVVLPTARSDAPRGVALYLISSLAEAGKRVALIDLAGSISSQALPAAEVTAPSVIGYDLGEGMMLIQPKSAEGLSAMSLQDALGPLRDVSDVAFILCPTLPDGAGIASASLMAAGAAIITAKPGTSDRDTVDHATAILSRHAQVRPYLVIE